MPPEDIIYAAHPWVTNASMIADMHRLGYLKDTDRILDPTYGKGAWWRVWRPENLEHPVYSPVVQGHWDFRAMWYPDEDFDAVTFDPPYVSPGGRRTTGIPQMHHAYGMDGTPLTPQGVQDDIDAGLAECYRVVKRGGIVLCKCQSYVTSGRLWPGLFLTYEAAMRIGFQLVDHIVHIAGPRPQPEGRGPQKHARRNQSDLLVFRRPKREPKHGA